MSIVANFTYSQNYGTITIATFTDTSTGTDATLTGRLLYIRKSDGTYLVPDGTTTDYIFWPIADLSISVDILDKDYALDVTVLWYGGSTGLYNKTLVCLFRAYSELFLRQLTQGQEAVPKLLTDKNFWYNKFKLRTLVDDAIQAVESLNDQTIATFTLEEAKKITDNPSLFFS